MTTTGRITKIESVTVSHGPAKGRKETAWAVSGPDGEKVGEVQSRWAESWRHTGTGVRFSCRGAYLTWKAIPAGSSLDEMTFRRRVDAVEWLLSEEAQR